MGITQRNDYLPGQDLNNMAVNVDDNRLENDQSVIELNFTTTPYTVTVKIGSIIEANGNSYVIDTADEVFQATNDTDNYITFDGTSFGSASAPGAFSPTKQGYYQIDNITRTLKWFIDSVAEEFSLNLDFIHKGTRFKTQVLDHLDHLSVKMASIMTLTTSFVIMPFTVIQHDEKGLFSANRYTVVDDGIYLIQVPLMIECFNTGNLRCYATLYLNGAPTTVALQDSYGTVGFYSAVLTTSIKLTKGDYIEIYARAFTNSTIRLVSTSTYLNLDRLF